MSFVPQLYIDLSLTQGVNISRGERDWAFQSQGQIHREDDLHVAEEYSLSASRRREYMFSDQQGLGASQASELC